MLLALVVVLFATGSWVPLVAVFTLLLPAGMILGGTSTIKMRYYWAQSMLRPVRLLTGERAVRRGWALISLGVLLLAWLLWQADRVAGIAFLP